MMKWQWEKGFWRDYADADSDALEALFLAAHSGGPMLVLADGTFSAYTNTRTHPKNW